MHNGKNSERVITPEEIKDRIKKVRGSGRTRIDAKFVRSLALVTSLGVTMVISVFIGMGLGMFLANRFKNDLFLPLGLFIGVAMGGYLIYNLIKPLLK